MKILVLCLVAALTVAHAGEEWQSFKQKFGKKYSSTAVESTRQNAYNKWKTLIEQHNQLFAKGKVQFSLGLNEFSDIPHKEFVRTMNGFRRPAGVATPVVQKVSIPNVSALPASVDWRTKGAVTGVKNQGQCGSCWSFSATGSLEGRTFIKTGKLVSLSEQNLVDCAGSSYGNYGCNGGLMTGAFKYVKANKGIDTTAYYPYKALAGTCKYSSSYIGATNTGYVNIVTGSEADLQNAVATYGPVSVAIDASLTSFAMYKSGIYYDSSCSSTNLDHGVLVVGYGTTSGQDYWIVKNSWGTSWGEQGYVRIARNRGNHCGIATMASYPTV